MRLLPENWLPAFLLPAGLLPIGSHYRVYRGLSRGALDDDAQRTLVAVAPAGVTQVAHGQGVDTDFWYEITAVSGAGVESAPASTADRCIRRVTRTADGATTAGRPNAVSWARASAAAGGKISISARYHSIGEPSGARARSLQVAFVIDGQPDWANLLGTIAIGPSGACKTTFTTVFTNGQNLYLAVRASTGGATPIYGPALRLAPVAADADAPDPVTIFREVS